MNISFIHELTEQLSNILLDEKLPLDIVKADTGELIVPARRRITKMLIKKIVLSYNNLDIDPSPVRNKIREIIDKVSSQYKPLELTFTVSSPLHRDMYYVSCPQMKFGSHTKNPGILINQLTKEFQEILESE